MEQFLFLLIGIIVGYLIGKFLSDSKLKNNFINQQRTIEYQLNEEKIKNVALPIMMNRGIGISDALIATGVFPETAISKFRQGEETGNIKKAAIQLANYYESDTVYRIKNFIEWVQIAIAMYILVIMLLLTIVSAETAIINPTKPGVIDKTK